ncbi:SCO family protein [Accumulibacter sp.]|jgi:protein SCO1/2|uniref:SCO family protein n=1 Tax=Accumulibacter sp. TaxID=2053492 RepID=UPI001AC7D6AE|nr:SCO family protein [Accumulibacter sp.]MBN8455842.1 SCO family protein [Accumulibacter sp.]
MRTNRFLIALIALLAAALLYLAAFWEPVPQRPVEKIVPHGQLPPGTAPAGGDFVLQGPQGSVALADYRGKVVLIYFGYTWCPDVCPTSLSLLAQAIADLDPAERERVQAIFISVDPERDTPTRLREYAPFFHPALIGLSGSREQIAAVATAYGSSYQKQPANAEGNYAVDHSSATYVVDPQGRLAGSLPHAASPAQIVAFVRQQLAAANTR